MTNPKSFLNASSLLCFSYFLRINCSPEKKSVENKSRAAGKVALGKVAPRKLNPSTVCALET